jgi:indolepyruvate decarboxylase
MPARSHTIGSYLIQRLQDCGIRHVFGIPGDYILHFYDLLQKSPIRLIGVTREDCAGFAADAYSRVNGIGAVCVTYCVGGLNVANAIAGAYAEKSPVVVLTGSPGLRERVNDPMLHHKVRRFSTQKEIFEQFTAAAVVLDDAETAFRRIDETLAICRQKKRPVYIELPRDMVDVVPRWASARPVEREISDRDALREALAESVAWINSSRQPVILADVEIHRYGLSHILQQFVDRTGIPVAATLLGKSVIGEKHPRYLGIYEGAMGRPEVERFVEGSDCLLMLGTLLTDVNLGIYTAHLDRSRSIEATSEKIQVRHHQYPGVLLADFLRGLLRARIRKRTFAIPHPPSPRRTSLRPGSLNAPMTVDYLFEAVNERLTDNMVVICDTGVSMFGAIDLTIHRGTEFLAPAYYTSMGFGVPAALGTQMARPGQRPIVLVGDGAFQMTGTELSTIQRFGLDPIVVLLNNHGYTTERTILEGPYNELADWHYDKTPELLGGGWGCTVRTRGEFQSAWKKALANRKSFSLLNVLLDKMDCPTGLIRLGHKLSARLRNRSRSSFQNRPPGRCSSETRANSA